MNNFPTMPRTDAGLTVPCTRLLATSIPCPRWMEHRQPLINGDTRRRKRRLREKLEKRDAIRYVQELRAVAAAMKRRVMDKIEREIFANKTDDVCASLRAHNRPADGSALPKIGENHK